MFNDGLGNDARDLMMGESGSIARGQSWQRKEPE